VLEEVLGSTTSIQGRLQRIYVPAARRQVLRAQLTLAPLN
jgi:hypothetical protein